ncbi:LytR/AlgR family response regulator transcription factor [Spirosoma radiotolerans]|uniref:Sensory transduction protein lytT n=1 Tax=Spirosoma radiotolerans TaxID=1379870 RepID=A0A0E3ZSN9_9BACT|nr:LytTR family DNA-binding domain-containing protein [Spirosoma radiotolerans]AKD54210.1 sensory transduction protein lytT [Spirosoma radiotolerans]
MNALIIEDEKLVALELTASIAEVDPTITIVGTVGSVKTALRWFAENAEPDLIFADIQLADGISFTIFEKFQLTCPIIFTTAYNEYAIQAFKVNGIDYLLKPVDWDELRKAITKARSLTKQPGKLDIDVQKLMAALNMSPTALKPTYKEHFLGNARNSWVPVRIADIAYIMRDELNFMVTNTSERYILDYDTLDQIESMLNPDQFYRASRHCIININSVQSVKGLANLKLQLILKAPNHQFAIDISRDKAPSFKKWLEK